MKHRLPRHRLGAASLVEMIVLIFVISIALGLVGTSLSNLLRVNARFTSFTEERSDLDRLVHRLRSDIHSAASTAMNGATLNLTISDSNSDDGVVYTLLEGQATRTVGDVTTRFRLPPRCSWSVYEEPLGNDRLLQFTFQTAALSEEGDTTILGTLIAEIGRQSRLSLPGGER